MTQWIITSSLLILAVLIIRTLGRDRLSARLRYALWGLVLLRLLCPVSIGESAISVQNLLPEDVQQTQISETYEPSETIQTGGTMQMPQMPQTPQTSVIPEETSHISYPMVIWVMGMVLVGGAFLVSNVRFYLRLRRSRQQAMHRHVPVYVSAAVETPCLFGFPMPAVYITPAVMEDESALEHVLAHELTHCRHFDHLWALLRCVCVTLHWYNPLVWAAAFLSQKDGELACDEGALRHLGDCERSAYAKTLLDMTCVGYKGMLTAATSMTGSESDLKTRVLRIVKNPKMPVWAGVAVLLIAAVAAISLFTGAKSPALEGVWRLEMSYLGGDTEGPASAYMEYEFYDTRGIRTMIVGDEIRSAEWFIYMENPVQKGVLEIAVFETEDVELYDWTLTEDTLTLSRDRKKMVLTRVEQTEEKPYLIKGPFSVNDLRCSRPDEDYYVNLSVLEQTELMYLLRSGTVTGTRDEVSSNLQYQYRFNINNHGADKNLHISNGLVYGDDKDRGYAVSNIDEIVAWLEEREWINARAYRANGISAEPVPTEGAVNIAWGSPARSYFMVPPNQTAWRDAVDLAKAVGVPDGSDMTIIERMDFGLYADGQHWYFDTDGTCYIAGAELYIAPEYTVTLMKMLQPYVDVISPDVGATLPNAGTTHYVLWNGLEGSTLRFVDGDTMEKLGIAIRESMSEAKSGEGIEYDEGFYKLFGERLGIEGRDIMISDRGELVIDWEQHYDLFEPEELLYLLSELFAEEPATPTMTPDEKLVAVAEEVLHFNKEYPITVELLAKAELGDRKFALVGSMNDVFEYYLIEYAETAGAFHVSAWNAAMAAPPEVSGYWPNYAVMGGTYLCWSVIPGERMATTPDGKAVDMNAVGYAVNDYTAIRFRMKNGSTIDTPISKGTGTRLMLQMFDGEWPVSTVPMVGKTEVTICELTFDYVTTGRLSAGSLGEVIDEDSLASAVQLARSDYEAWKDEEWCLSMKVLDAVVHEEESARFREMYEGFEEGWTGDYLAENFVAVRVTYKCELDHNKIFYPDGEIVKDTLLVRADRDADWEIWDYSPEISIDPPDGRGESEVS